MLDHPTPLLSARRHASESESGLQPGVPAGGTGRPFVIARSLVQLVLLQLPVRQLE